LIEEWERLLLALTQPADEITRLRQQAATFISTSIVACC